jgi:UDP-2,3-diacylglucosamine hydrolase
VSGSTVVIVSDAHLGSTPSDLADSLHRFLDRVPDLGDHLVINGDLFEFWFEYRQVIPRGAFPTLERLSRVRRAGVALTLTGGNHDRWGGEFWRQELDAAFHPHGAELGLAGYATWLSHGDGVSDRLWSARALNAITRYRATVGLFRMLHPDLGMRVVQRLSPYLAGKRMDAAARRRAADLQERHALGILARRGDLELVVLGHTHYPRLVEVGEGRWYLNPGAWCEGRRYAILGAQGPQLAVFAD